MKPFSYQIILLCLLVFFVLPGYSKYPANPSNPDTANYPYWVQMMQDPHMNFDATQSAFNKYWQNRTVTKGDGWKVFKRWEYINEPRIQPDGKLPEADYLKNQYDLYHQTHQQKSPNGGWSMLGPVGGQISGIGRVNTIGFHPNNANIMYAGAPSGGFWKTNDGGGNWTNLCENLPTLGVSAILVNPINPDIIWIGTGDRDGGAAPGMGVYKSPDGGMTWVASNIGMGNKTVGMLQLNPLNSDMILAATSSGIFKSIDGGANWTLKSSNANNYKDIQFKPGDPTIAYATEGGKFYRSTNTGDSWTQISLPMSGLRLVIGVSPSNPTYVYVVQTNNSVFTGLLRSCDGGLTFTIKSTAPNIMDRSCDGLGTAGQAFYDLCIAVDPNNAETILVGGIVVWKSFNGGTTWDINYCNKLYVDIHCLAFSMLSGNIFACADGGIYYTANSGTSWSDISTGLAIGEPYKIGQSATNGPLVISGYQDTGTEINHGTTFQRVYGGDGMECLIDYTDTNYRYGELYYGVIFRSTGSGYAVIGGNATNGINEDGNWVTPFILHESNPNIMFAGYKNVWRCNNVKDASGITWSPISSGETTRCVAIEQSPANFNILYVSRGNQLKRTSNANAANPVWTICASPGNIYITDIETHPSDSNIVYVTGYNYVYKSTDKGTSWTNITGTLPAIPINCLIYDKNSNEGIYIGNQIGVFYKNANLSDWVAFNTGLPVIDVRELELFYGNDYANSKIKAATFGRGLWQSDLIETIGVINPTSFNATPESPIKIKLNWNKNQNNNNVIVAYNITNTFGMPLNGNIYLPGTGIPIGGTVIYNGNANNYSHTPLIGNTSYYYKIWSYDGTLQYSLGEITNATTLCNLIESFPWYEGFENSGTMPICWTQEHWLTSTSNWLVQHGGYTGGVNPSTAHTGYYNATLYSGANLALTKFITPPLNLIAVSNPVLRFWHTQFTSYYQDELRIYYKSGLNGTWNLLTSYTNNISNWTQESIQLPNPSSIYFVSFEGKSFYGNGVCIDDIAITTNSLTWNGSGNWTSYTNWNPPYVPAVFDTSIINTGNCLVSTDVIGGIINIRPGATLSVDSSKTLIVGENITIERCDSFTTVGVSITASANPICSVTMVTFIATPFYGGTTPLYQWKINGIDTGNNSSVLSYIPSNGDLVSCVIISNADCPSNNPTTSNIIAMVVDPVAPTVGNHVALQTQIVWDWEPVPGVMGYRWNTVNNFATASDIGLNTSKTDTGLLCSTLYTRYVWAYKACGYSPVCVLTQGTALCDFTCGQLLTDTRDYQSYSTVLIGSQCWMAKNLNMGTRINNTVNQTNNNVIEKYCYSDNDANCTVYGGLYQWDEQMNYTTSSANNPSGRQGICPIGWHIPSYNEICQLESFLDATVYCNGTGWRGTDAGGKMKEAGTAHWSSPNTGATNSSGFTAIPGGNRYNTGGFGSQGYYAFFCSATESSATAVWYCHLSYTQILVWGGGTGGKMGGMSVRCLKD
jgi:uncharacterized protein (TIGR02145 family)